MTVASLLAATTLLAQPSSSSLPTASSTPLLAEHVNPYVGAGHYTADTSGNIGFLGGGFNFNLNVGGGYFITDEVMFGGSLGFSAGGGGVGFGLGLNASYWAKLQDRIYLRPFVSVGVNPSFSAAGASAWFNLAAGAGLPIFITDWMAIEPRITVGLNFPLVTPDVGLSWGMSWFF